MKFVHAADLHLDSPLRGLERYEGAPVEEIRGATRRAFAKLIDLCIERDAQVLVLAGDVFDGDWPDMSTGMFFASELGRLRAAGVRVFSLRGNHDAASKLTKRLPSQDHVHWFATSKPETVVLEDLGLAIHGQGYAKAKTTDDLAAQYPEARPGMFNIGVLHTALDGREGHGSYAPTSVETLRTKGYDYWALGHVHAREIVAEDPWVVFPGNLQGRHALETGAKGATVVDVDEDGVAHLEQVALDVVRWDAVEVVFDDEQPAEDVDAVLLAVRRAADAALAEADGRLLALRLTLRGAAAVHDELQNDLDGIVAALRVLIADAAADAGEACWVEKLRIETRAPLDLAAVRERDDLVGEVARNIEALRADPAAVHALLPPELDRKLRAEAVDALGVEDAAGLRAALAGAEQILLDALVGRGDA